MYSNEVNDMASSVSVLKNDSPVFLKNIEMVIQAYKEQKEPDPAYKPLFTELEVFYDKVRNERKEEGAAKLYLYQEEVFDYLQIFFKIFPDKQQQGHHAQLPFLYVNIIFNTMMDYGFPRLLTLLEIIRERYNKREIENFAREHFNKLFRKIEPDIIVVTAISSSLTIFYHKRQAFPQYCADIEALYTESCQPESDILAWLAKQVQDFLTSGLYFSDERRDFFFRCSFPPDSPPHPSTEENKVNFLLVLWIMKENNLTISSILPELISVESTNQRNFMLRADRCLDAFKRLSAQKLPPSVFRKWFIEIFKLPEKVEEFILAARAEQRESKASIEVSPRKELDSTVVEVASPLPNECIAVSTTLVHQVSVFQPSITTTSTASTPTRNKCRMC